MTSESACVAVIGAGTMGRGIANTFAVGGHRVLLADSELQVAERAKSTINDDITVAIEEGFVPASAREAVLERIDPVETLEKAVEGAAVVVEAVPEILDLKVEIWRRLGESADEATILASNTSSFDINELARVVEPRPERVIGTHWYNPAHIVPCVEVIPAEPTSQATIDATIELLSALGKEPALTKSVPGFVGNRIQMVMAAEAFRCVEEGIATPEAVDAIVRSSFGFRLGAFGPLRVADLAGLDTYKGVFDYLTERCGSPWYEAPSLLTQLVEEGRTGVKSLGGIYDYSPEDAAYLVAERDRTLYRHLRMYLKHETQTREGPSASDGAVSS